MSREFEHLNEKEALKAENDFLKMKMMLENGAHIGSTDDPAFTPEMENQFLKNVIALEEQFAEHKTIKLFDKIERPTIFKAVDDIADDEIEGALDSIMEWLAQYNINLTVYSPNVSMRTLYRFIIEELFEYEMDDFDLPGWTNNFVYDQFHPDPYYENETAAVDDCISIILSKASLDWMSQYRSGDLQLNDHFPISEDNMQQFINNFKNAYDDIECTAISDIVCQVDGTKSTVTGQYKLKLTNAGSEEILGGQWRVEFETPDNFYWYIFNVQIEGINF
ncbi:MAG: hypothetical protein ABIT58_09755 [Ferruginibacter sp.]